MNKNEKNVTKESGKKIQREKHNVAAHLPITPSMLITALLKLKDNKLLGLTYTAEEVAHNIQDSIPAVQQDWDVLLLEVTDKLRCAAEADFIGLKKGSGYYPLNLKEQSNRLDSKSELLFWVLYKRVLDQRTRESKTDNKRSVSRGEENPEDVRKKKRKIGDLKFWYN